MNNVASVIVAASAVSLNLRPSGGDDFTVTSRQSSAQTQQHRQVPVPGASYSGVESFLSVPRPEATSVDSRFRRTQSSTAVYGHSQAADSVRQNGSAVGAYSLGSTYDEGDYDPVDSIRAGTATTPVSTLSLQRQQRQTSSTSTSYTLPPPQQQQQQPTGTARGHHRTLSTGLADVDRRPPAQVAFNNGSISRVRVETNRREHTDSPQKWNQQAGYRVEENRVEEIQQQSTARRQGSNGNVMVVTNAGYEPTTLEHRTLQTVVQSQPAPVVAPNMSTSSRLNGDSGRQQSSVRYDQTNTAVRQHVQQPSYATVHQVQQTTSPGSSAFQRAVIVNTSEPIPQQHQQTGKQLDLLEQQLRQQQEMLLKQREEEKLQLQQRLMTRQQHEQQEQTQQQSGADQRQHQSHDQLQHQVMMRQRQMAVAQNVAAGASRNTPNRLPVNQVVEDDGQRRFRSSTVTNATSAFERTGTKVMNNGPSRSGDLPTLRPVQATDRRQSPGNFSTNQNSSRSSLQSSGGDEYTVRRPDLIGGGIGDVAGSVVRRGGGADTPSSMSSASSSWRSPTTIGGKQQQRLSTASSSAATEHSSGNDSSLDRASSSGGERRFLFSKLVSEQLTTKMNFGCYLQLEFLFSRLHNCAYS